MPLAKRFVIRNGKVHYVSEAEHRQNLKNERKGIKISKHIKRLMGEDTDSDETDIEMDTNPDSEQNKFNTEDIIQECATTNASASERIQECATTNASASERTQECATTNAFASVCNEDTEQTALDVAGCDKTLSNVQKKDDNCDGSSEKTCKKEDNCDGSSEKTCKKEDNCDGSPEKTCKKEDNCDGSSEKICKKEDNCDGSSEKTCKKEDNCDGSFEKAWKNGPNLMTMACHLDDHPLKSQTERIDYPDYPPCLQLQLSFDNFYDNDSGVGSSKNAVRLSEDVSDCTMEYSKIAHTDKDLQDDQSKIDVKYTDDNIASDPPPPVLEKQCSLEESALSCGGIPPASEPKLRYGIQNVGQRLIWCKLCDSYYFNVNHLKLHITDIHQMDSSRVNRYNYATWDLEIAKTFDPPEDEEMSVDGDVLLAQAY